MLAVGVVLPATASAATIDLAPGQTVQINGNLAIPPLPPKLDFVLLLDTTGSMGGELANAKTGATPFFNSVRADSPDAMFSVSSFEDYPYSTFGQPMLGDQPYRRHIDLTDQSAAWQSAVNSLTLRGGGDLPESHVPAMYAIATGSALTWPGGSVASGQGISFREDAPHVVALISDGPFHNDSAEADPYSFADPPTYAEALTALTAEQVRVIAADSSEVAPEPDLAEISAATNGGHTRLAPTGAWLYSGSGTAESPGILGALRALTYPVTHQVSCEPLQASLQSSSWADVPGASIVPYSQTISVPEGLAQVELPSTGMVDCVTAFFWAGLKIAEHSTDVHVSFPPPPNSHIAADAMLPPPDTIPPRLNIWAPKKQRLGAKVKVKATSDEDCALEITGTAKPRDGRKVALGRRRIELDASVAETLELKPTRKLARALKAAGMGNARLSASCTDAARNVSHEKALVKLR